MLKLRGKSARTKLSFVASHPRFITNWENPAVLHAKGTFDLVVVGNFGSDVGLLTPVLTCDRQIRYTADTFEEKFKMILDEFPKIEVKLSGFATIAASVLADCAVSICKSSALET
jgi:hypothetical protein